MVLRLIDGLTESYSTFVTVFQNMTPLRSFTKAKSMLLLDETNKRCLASEESGSDSTLLTTSFIVPSSSHDFSTHESRQNTSNNRGRRNSNHGRGQNYHHSRDGCRGGHHQSEGHSNSTSNGSHSHNQNSLTPWTYPPWPIWGPQPWATPPCPYPTIPLLPCHVNPTTKQPSILGPLLAALYYYTTSTAPSVILPLMMKLLCTLSP